MGTDEEAGREGKSRREFAGRHEGRGLAREREFGAGVINGADHRGRRAGVGDDGEARVKGSGETEGLASKFGFIQGEDRALGSADHLALGGDDQGVVIPNAIFGDASAAENREIGVGLLERLFAQRADENPEAAVNTAAGDDGFHASDFAEEGRDRE